MARESSSKTGGQPKKAAPARQGARRPSLLRRREGRAAALIVAAVILVIALIPGEAGPPTLIGWDKLDHAAAFAALALLARCGWPGVARWRLALPLLVYGVAIELAQAVSGTGRVASISDIAADALGIALGLVIAWALGRVGRAAPFLSRR